MEKEPITTSLAIKKTKIVSLNDKEKEHLVSWCSTFDWGKHCNFIHGLFWVDAPNKSYMFTDLNDFKEWVNNEENSNTSMCDR